MLFGKSRRSGGPLTSQRILGEDGSALYLAPLRAGVAGVEEVPLRFVDVGGRAHVLFSAASPPGWVSWATTSSPVQWRIRGATFVGTPEVVDDRTGIHEEILAEYRLRFGAERVARWFGPDVGCIALPRSPKPLSYYDQVEGLFDRAASAYDRIVLRDPLNVHLRQVSARVLHQLFPPGSRVLEIGCGTGLETMALAESGVDIVALDISRKMLIELDRKARAASLSDRIEIRRGLAGDLSSIFADLGPGAFDGAFSHFGALNCEPRLDGLPGALHRLVRPGGKISLGVLNRTSVAEMVLYTAAHQPRHAMARLDGKLRSGLSSFGVAVFPLGAAAVRRLFSPFFAQEKLLGVSVLLPPAHLGRRLLPHPELLAVLEWVDGAVAGWPLVRNLGDYFLMQLVRR